LTRLATVTTVSTRAITPRLIGVGIWGIPEWMLLCAQAGSLHATERQDQRQAAGHGIRPHDQGLPYGQHAKPIARTGLDAELDLTTASR
jgi:hypothetical protein